jgi:potassium efflux system protein
VILQRLPLDAGARYAARAIARYLIAIAGTMLGFGALGLGWSDVQWLVAAMTVGLGFGLQEIFANFVSGIILLFERPIRVGDTVTLGTTTGTVSKIHTRATTITDFDRKELVVPNREFITGQLINWSLSDPILRVVVDVGVAYGSDVALTEAKLLEVAKECPYVLKDPEPSVLFDAFGSSSLDFQLRAFIAGFDDWLRTRHELHTAIDAKFREAGIEISFPQRDLHLRTVDGSIPVKIEN